MKKLNVGLFFGGTSKERDVSLRTGETVARYLDPKKYNVFPIEISMEGKWLLESPTIKKIRAILPTAKVGSARSLAPLEKNYEGRLDVAFLALHGPGGEDGTIQGMLELLKIPYTCSGVLASSVAMDKVRTKMLVAQSGVPVLPHLLIKKYEYREKPNYFLKKIKGKVAIKPNKMGSSIGINVVKEKKRVKDALESAFVYDDEVVVESFAEGREITVPVIGNRNFKALPTIEIIPWRKSAFYDYSAKYERGGSEHIIPAPLTGRQGKQVQNYAVAAHAALGCRGVTRSDFILTGDGKFVFLEINTIPGMTPTSLAPQSAAAAGIDFPEFIDILIKLAMEK